MTEDEAQSLASALEACVEAHGRQRRKFTGEPYAFHPIRVCASLLGHVPVEVLIAALLHDVVEDTSWTLEDVSAEFGSDVSGIVDRLTKRPDETHAEYIDRVKESAAATTVKIADIRDNLNLNGCSESLRKRYIKALGTLIPEDG